jgi:hypothetical protein
MKNALPPQSCETAGADDGADKGIHWQKGIWRTTTLVQGEREEE